VPPLHHTELCFVFVCLCASDGHTQTRRHVGIACFVLPHARHPFIHTVASLASETRVCVVLHRPLISLLSLHCPSTRTPAH
jgi:hypothetical protein